MISHTDNHPVAPVKQPIENVICLRVLFLTGLCAFGISTAAAPRPANLGVAQAARASVAQAALSRVAAGSVRPPEMGLRVYRDLDSMEEAIALHPFPSRSAAVRLRKALAKLQNPVQPEAPRDRHSGRGDMAWVWPDSEYWKRIPPAAQQIPADWSGLPGVNFTNSEVGGVREVRLAQGPEFDQWLLNDPEHELSACISIERNTKRIYFMQFARRKNGKWRLRPAKDNCYSCHPSGPRVIRPFEERRVDRLSLERFNRLILSYGSCDFGDSIDSRLRGALSTDARCVGCHNGLQRGKLYTIHRDATRFKAEQEQTMPPAASLPAHF